MFVFVRVGLVPAIHVLPVGTDEDMQIRGDIAALSHEGPSPWVRSYETCAVANTDACGNRMGALRRSPEKLQRHSCGTASKRREIHPML